MEGNKEGPSRGHLEATLVCLVSLGKGAKALSGRTGWWETDPELHCALRDATLWLQIIESETLKPGNDFLFLPSTLAAYSFAFDKADIIASYVWPVDE